MNEQQAYEIWVSQLPPAVQEVIKTHPPTQMYRFKSTLHHCQIISYESPEGGEVGVTVTVQKTGTSDGVMLAPHLHTNKVFGVSLDDLEPKPIDNENTTM